MSPHLNFDARGWVTGIERCSTRDGPGIRTTVFFKGCPLRCTWCSSPDTWRHEPDLAFRLARCQRCAACLRCPEGAIDLLADHRVDRDTCTRCMECVELCAHGALETVGWQVSVGDVVSEVLRDTPFYEGGGGATLGGGEPLSQPEFLAGLTEALRAHGVSVVLDTSGEGAPALLARLLPALDLVLFDIKHMDSRRHRAATGIGNERILDNARRVACDGKLRLSLPLVPGFNDDDANVLATGRFAQSLKVAWVDLMPLHRLGAAKYGFLGMPSPYPQFGNPPEDRIARIRDMLESLGLRVTVGRMM